MDATEARTYHMRNLVAAAGGPAEWARRFGGTRWQQPQVSAWISESNPKSIGRRLARDLEQVQSLPRGSLDLPPKSTDMDGEPAIPPHISPAATPSGYVRLPLLEGFAGMGRGDYVGDYPEVVDWVEVTREWAAQKLAGIPHEAVRVITGRGASMRGVFNDGDLVFVDSRVKQFDADAAYVFRWDGRVQIKRLQHIGKGRLRILSANPDYPPLEVGADEIEVGGRAVAAWTLREL